MPTMPMISWSAALGASIEKQMNSIGVTRDRWFTQLIAHAQVMRLEKLITFEMYDKLVIAIIAIESCSEKPLVENGWRDVAGDALRVGDFKRAVALLFSNAPEAMPYVSALEALARATIAHVELEHQISRFALDQVNQNQLRVMTIESDALRLKVCVCIDKFIEVRDGASASKGWMPHVGQRLAFFDVEYVEKLEELASATGQFIAQANVDWDRGRSLSAALQTHDFAETWRLLNAAYHAYCETAKCETVK